MTHLEGALNSSTLNGILQVLIDKNPASTWQISDGQDEKVVYFSTGGIRLYASEGRMIASMEDYLTRRGLVAKDQLAVALEISQQSRRDPLVDVLERRGMLARDRFLKAIEELIYEELCDLVTWENAIFEFYEGNPPPEIFDQEHPALFGSLDVKAIAQRVKDWNQEWSSLKSKVYSERLRPKLMVSYAQLTEGKELPVHVRRLYSAMDGQRTLREVCKAAACSFAEAARVTREAIKDGVARGSMLQEKTLSTPEEVLQEIEKLEEALDKAINTILIHKRIAADYEKIDEKDRASEHYHAIGNLQAQAGQVGKALENYRHAITLSPQNIGAHESLIRRLQDLGEENQALDEILALTRKLISFGLLGRAYESLRGIVSKVAHRFDIRLLFADLLTRLGRIPEAVREYLGVARDKKKLGQVQGIEEIFRKVLALDPVNREARAGISQEKRRQVGKKVVWLHRMSAAAALLLLAAWAANEFLARQAWAATEDSMRKAMGRGELGLAFERLRAFGKKFPANLLARSLLEREKSLFKEAFFRIEENLERAGGLLQKRQFLKAQELFQKISICTFTDSQLARAQKGVQVADGHRQEWQALRRKAKELLDARFREEAFQICRRIIENYPDGAGGLEIPFLITSEPAGAEVSVDEVVWGYTPMWITLLYGSQRKVAVRQPGYAPQTLQDLEGRKSPKVHVTLRRQN